MASVKSVPLLATESSVGNAAASTSKGPPPPASPPSSQTPRRSNAVLFRCNGYGDCAMVFTRSEHLARHVRKHTGDKPFTCHCGRNFSRLDNVRQHATTVHAEDTAANAEMMTRLMALHNSLSAKTIAMQIEMGMVVKDGDVPKRTVNAPGVGPNGGKTVAKNKGVKAKGKKKKGEEEDEVGGGGAVPENDASTEGRGQFSVQAVGSAASRKRNDGHKMAMAHQQQQALQAQAHSQQLPPPHHQYPPPPSYPPQQPMYYDQYGPPAPPQQSPHYAHAIPPQQPHYPPYSGTPPPGSAGLPSQPQPGQTGGSPSPRRRQPPPPTLLPPGQQPRYAYNPAPMGYSASPPLSHHQLQHQPGSAQQPPTPPGGPLTPGGVTQRGVTLPSISQLLPTRYDGQGQQQQQQQQQVSQSENPAAYYSQDGPQMAHQQSHQPSQQQMRGPPSAGSTGHGRHPSLGSSFMPPADSGYGGEMQQQQQHMAMQQHAGHYYTGPPPTGYEPMYARQGMESGSPHSAYSEPDPHGGYSHHAPQHHPHQQQHYAPHYPSSLNPSSGPPAPVLYGKPTYQLPSPALSHGVPQYPLPNLPPLPPLPNQGGDQHDQQQSNYAYGGQRQFSAGPSHLQQRGGQGQGQGEVPRESGERSGLMDVTVGGGEGGGGGGVKREREREEDDGGRRSGEWKRERV